MQSITFTMYAKRKPQKQTRNIQISSCGQVNMIKFSDAVFFITTALI